MSRAANTCEYLVRERDIEIFHDSIEFQFFQRVTFISLTFLIRCTGHSIFVVVLIYFDKALTRGVCLVKKVLRTKRIKPWKCARAL
jgi:hypothetical protein